MTIEVEEQGYSISRKMINDLYQVLIQNGLQHTANEMYKTFRSRPHSPLTQNTTDCPHHCSVFRNGFDNNAPMEHHCDFLNNTCEVEEEKIRQDATEKVLGEVRKTIDGGLPDMEHTLNRIFAYLREKGR